MQKEKIKKVLMYGPDDEYEVLDVYKDGDSSIVYDLEENQHVYTGDE